MANEGGGHGGEDGHGHSHHHGHSHGGSGHGHSHGGNGHGHSHGGEDGEEGHAHDLTVGLTVLGGILAFLIVEKLVRIFNDGHSHSHGGGEAKPAGKPSSPSKAKKEKADEGAKGDGNKDKGKKKKDKNSDSEDGSEKEKSPSKKQPGAKQGEATKATSSDPPAEEIRVAGFLNLFADFFHNFTDGMAIGASYLAGNSVGMVTAFTILFHEIPHEIGDYAILVQSGAAGACPRAPSSTAQKIVQLPFFLASPGVPPFKAKCLQLLTAVGALLGCVISLVFGDLGDAVTAYILSFTAGKANSPPITFPVALFLYQSCSF